MKNAAIPSVIPCRAIARANTALDIQERTVGVVLLALILHGQTPARVIWPDTNHSRRKSSKELSGDRVPHNRDSGTRSHRYRRQ